MKKLLKILSLVVVVLIVLLLPLFGVYAATVSSLPGERIYPVKQKTEIAVGKLSEVSPLTLAYFSLLKSQRRYQEVLGLIDQDKDVTGASALFLDQAKKTLFDIQSIADGNTRISFFSQYQTFLANTRQSLAYKAASLKDQLGIDRASSIKTFSIDEFQSGQGKLALKRKAIPIKGITEKEPVPDSLIFSNITSLEETEQALSALIQQ